MQERALMKCRGDVCNKQARWEVVLRSALGVTWNTFKCAEHKQSHGPGERVVSVVAYNQRQASKNELARGR
jgi:hypothetical protein